MGYRQVLNINLGVGNLYAINYSGTVNTPVQTFTANETGKLEVVEAALTRGGSPSGNLYLELYSGGVPGEGTLLATSNTIPTSQVILANGVSYHKFIFSSLPSLTNGQQYYIKYLATYPISTVNFIQIKGATTGAYAGGVMYSTTDGINYNTIGYDASLTFFYRASILFTNYISGSDTTGSGDILAPYKTIAQAMTVQSQADEIKPMEDEPISVTISIPLRSSYLYSNMITGVNSLGIEDGTRRIISSVGGLASCFSIGFSYGWTIKNLQIGDIGAGFSAPLNATATNGFNNTQFYNCKFKSCGTLSGTNIGNRVTFIKCVFEDIIHTANSQLTGATTVPTGVFLNCTFRRVSCTNNTSYSALNAMIFDNCLVVDCSANRYGFTAAYQFTNNVIDRFTFTGTGNVDNNFSGANISVAYNLIFQNNLFTNMYFANTPDNNTIRKTLFVFTSASGQAYLVNRNAYYNIGSADALVIGNKAVVALFSENVIEALPESPWKNDDGVIANPMSCYEYKESYLWRRKNQLLTDISGWSYPT